MFGGAGDGLDCLDGLRAVSFGELGLARLEVRPVGPQEWDEGQEKEERRRRRGRQRTELLLGDVHTGEGGGRRVRRYRPTAMQPYSMVRASQVGTGRWGGGRDRVDVGRTGCPRIFF